MISVPLITCACIWALAPIAIPDTRTAGAQSDEQSQPQPTQETSGSIAALNLLAFNEARLWNPVPPPLAPEVKTIAPENSADSLRLQLLGIITEDGVRSAAIYDQAEDRILILQHGDSVGRHTVTDVTDSSVVFTDGSRTERLELIAMGSPS